MLLKPAKALVDFFIVGVQKGGTSALDRLLRESPGVRMAREKEPHFFDDDTIDWNDVNFQDYHSHFEFGADEVVAVGEATPVLSYWPNALERVAAYNPEARIIFLLRHPSFRAHSNWRMETLRRRESLPFSDAIRDVGRTRVRSAPGGTHRVFAYVERGFYSDQVRRIRSLFPPQNVLFLRTDALWLEPERVLNETRLFLGIRSDNVPLESEYHVPLDTRGLGAMSPADRRYLDAHFAEDIRITASLTSLDLSDWQDATYVEPMGRAD